MASEMELLLKELRGIREHLAGLDAAAQKLLDNQFRDRLFGLPPLLETQQAEFDKQALRWSVLQKMTPEEYEERYLKRLEEMASWTRR
jgi:hypothetical protein